MLKTFPGLPRPQYLKLFSNIVKVFVYDVLTYRITVFHQLSLDSRILSLSYLLKQFQSSTNCLHNNNVKRQKKEIAIHVLFIKNKVCFMLLLTHPGRCLAMGLQVIESHNRTGSQLTKISHDTIILNIIVVRNCFFRHIFINGQ